MTSRVKNFIAIILLFLVLLWLISLLYIPKKSGEFGVSFSAPFTRYLGLDPKVVLESALRDFGFKKIRLSAYWSDVEQVRDVYNFEDVKWQLDLAKKYNAKVIMSVGQKLPRWPECHNPGWYGDIKNDKERDEEILQLVKESVNALKSYDVIDVWQVENEAIFGFGDECPKKSIDFLKSEVDLVRSLDGRPTLVADSGEMGRWIPSVLSGADLFGSTLYFKVYMKQIGYFEYPKTPIFWHIKAGILELVTGKKRVLGVELQAEPWVTKGFLEVPVRDQLELMNPEVFDLYLVTAKDIGFEDYYLWGFEWWYWMKHVNGSSEMWDHMLKLGRYY